MGGWEADSSGASATVPRLPQPLSEPLDFFEGFVKEVLYITHP